MTLFKPIKSATALPKEYRLRKEARKLGYEIRKARRYLYQGGFVPVPGIDGLSIPTTTVRSHPPTMSGGGYRLVRLSDDTVVLGGERWDATLEEIHSFIRIDNVGDATDTRPEADFALNKDKPPI